MIFQDLKFSTIAVGFVLSSVGSAFGSSQLAGSEWGSDTPVEQFIQFNADGTLSGNAGCNSISGSYSLLGERLEIGPIASTKKLCDDNVMAAERSLLDALEATGSYFIETQIPVLVLTDERGQPQIRLQRRDWD